MIVARLLDRSEVAHLLEALLQHEVTLVPLDAAPGPGMHSIELQAPGLEAPFVVRAELVGEPVGSMIPLKLEAAEASDVELFRSFVARYATKTDPSATADEPPALAIVGEFMGMGLLDAPPRPPRSDRAPTDPEIALPAARESAPGATGASSAPPPDLLVFRPPSRDEPPPTPLRRRPPSSGGFVMPAVRRPIVDVAEDRPVPPAPLPPRPPSPPPAPAKTAPPPAPPTSSRPPMRPVPSHARLHSIAGGKYEVGDVIGEGGTGTVYRARHVALDKPIAIKVLNPAFQGDEQFAKRFHREALAASKLDHPNVMRVLDFGQEPDGLLYLVMEYLDGRDLQSLLDQNRVLSTFRVVEIMSQVCAALSVAHDAGIVHRDIKPENVVIVRNRDDDGSLVDVVKVLDFGIAKIGDTTSPARSRLTAVGTIWGTPHYMAPEQARAETADARSDIYACGVVLYEMATGQVPFNDASPLTIALMHVKETPPPPSQLNPDIDPRLEAVILRAMSKDPARRQQTARELRADLRAVLESALDEKTIRRDVGVGGDGFPEVKTEVSPPPIDTERTQIVTSPGGPALFEDERPAVVILEEIGPARHVGRAPPTLIESEELAARHPTVTPPTSVRLADPLPGRIMDAEIDDAPTLTPPTSVRIPTMPPVPPRAEDEVGGATGSSDTIPAPSPGGAPADQAPARPPPPEVELPSPKTKESGLHRPVIPGAAGEPTPLDAQGSGFAELFVALTSSVARTSYYERSHPEFDRALGGLLRAVGAPLQGRGEVTIARRDVSHVPQLFVQTGLGEQYELRKLLTASVVEAYGGRMTDVFVRRHMISLTLKEGIEAGEVGDMVELLSGPDLPMDQLRTHFLSRGLRHLSILFAADLIGRERRLPWEVDLCISRLARDLRALPLLRGVDLDGMRQLRAQLIGDVIRTLRGPEPVKILLQNNDLVTAAVKHVPELASVDLASPLVDALRMPLCVSVSYLLLTELEEELSRAGANDKAGAASRKLVKLIGMRFVRERTVQSDEVLRELHKRAILSFPDLPEDLQLWILAEQRAQEIIANPEPILRNLDTTNDQSQYAREMRTVERTMRVLARRGEAVALWAVVARLERHARGAEAGEGSREALASRTLRAIQDADLLAPVAQALLGGPVAVRDAARGILVSAARPGARALCAARARSTTEIGRPRFVATLREIGANAAAEVGEAISALDPTGASGDPALAEDLLRAVPEVANDDLGKIVVRFLRHSAGAVRRMAATALAGAWGAKAQPELLRALDDGDEGVRVAVLGGLRRVGGIDAAVVVCVDEILSGDVAAGDELCASAAACLFDVVDAARPAAVQVLTRALEAKAKGALSRMVSGGPTKSVESPLVVETVGRVLLAIAGSDGRAMVEKRAERAPEPLRGRLLALLK